MLTQAPGAPAPQRVGPTETKPSCIDTFAAAAAAAESEADIHHCNLRDYRLINGINRSIKLIHGISRWSNGMLQLINCILDKLMPFIDCHRLSMASVGYELHSFVINNINRLSIALINY